MPRGQIGDVGINEDEDEDRRTGTGDDGQQAVAVDREPWAWMGPVDDLDVGERAHWLMRRRFRPGKEWAGCWGRARVKTQLDGASGNCRCN